jgi:sialidase-1
MRRPAIIFLFTAFLFHTASGQPEVHIKPWQVPVMIGEEANPIFRIAVNILENTSLKSIKLKLGGASIDDIKSVSVYYSESDSIFNPDTRKGIKHQQIIQEEMLLKPKLKLASGINYIWISCLLNEDANLTNTFSAQIDGISFGRYDYYPNTPSPIKYRYGIAVRKHNQDGIHTARIPGLATSSEGTLMAIYDARRASSRDLQGDIDIGLNRSLDNGRTWEPLQIIMDMDEWGDLPQKFNGVSDACILVNGKEIFVAGLWMHGVINPDGKWIEGLNEDSTAWNHQWRNKGSQPGLSPKQTSQFLITKSADDGKTWSKPINLTKSCKKEAWWLWAPAPGRGIVMEDGTLVFPTQGRDENGLPFSNITFSRDGGTSWETSNPASHNTTENSVVEYQPGKLMLNIRDNRNRQNKSDTNGRAVFVTSDMGESWTEHPSSHHLLIEPVCMGSLHKHRYEQHGVKKEVLLFANPNSKYERINLTIKMSFDQGNTWPMNKWILLDEGKGRGYSCITSIDDHTIGILYEGSRADLIFQKIDISAFLAEE